MLSVTLRAAEAFTRAAPPPPKPVTAGELKQGTVGVVAGLAIMFAIVAVIILPRIGIYAMTHSHQPMFAPILALFG